MNYENKFLVDNCARFSTNYIPFCWNVSSSLQFPLHSEACHTRWRLWLCVKGNLIHWKAREVLLLWSSFWTYRSKLPPTKFRRVASVATMSSADVTQPNKFHVQTISSRINHGSFFSPSEIFTSIHFQLSLHFRDDLQIKTCFITQLTLTDWIHRPFCVCHAFDDGPGHVEIHRVAGRTRHIDFCLIHTDWHDRSRRGHDAEIGVWHRQRMTADRFKSHNQTSSTLITFSWTSQHQTDNVEA